MSLIFSLIVSPISFIKYAQLGIIPSTHFHHSTFALSFPSPVSFLPFSFRPQTHVGPVQLLILFSSWNEDGRQIVTRIKDRISSTEYDRPHFLDMLTCCKILYNIGILVIYRLVCLLLLTVTNSFCQQCGCFSSLSTRAIGFFNLTFKEVKTMAFFYRRSFEHDNVLLLSPMANSVGVDILIRRSASHGILTSVNETISESVFFECLTNFYFQFGVDVPISLPQYPMTIDDIMAGTHTLSIQLVSPLYHTL